MSSPDYLSSLFSLDGMVAVVTGGSSGIGRGIAGALAHAGASVVIVARRETELAATVKELEADGCRAASFAGDLSTRDGVREVAEGAAAIFGEPDILVNSAGINLRPPMGELSDEVWDVTMAVNLEAPFLLGRRFGPGMAERGFGRIIHVTSQQAHRAFVQSGAYGVSKGALESLAIGFAREIGIASAVRQTGGAVEVPDDLRCRLDQGVVQPRRSAEGALRCDPIRGLARDRQDPVGTAARARNPHERVVPPPPAGLAGPGRRPQLGPTFASRHVERLPGGPSLPGGP